MSVHEALVFREKLDALSRERHPEASIAVPDLSMPRQSSMGDVSASRPRVDEAYEQRVQMTLDSERARREARRRLDAEERGPATLPVFDTLRVRLARPQRAAAFLIEGWQPSGSRVMLTAQAKAGKTTLVGNLIRSLADGDAFLGQHTVAPVEGTVALLDFEMGGAQLNSWLRAQSIHSDGRVLVLSMRGCGASFDILDDRIRADWVRSFQQHQVRYLILDCLRPILDALGLDEHRDTGRFLVALDALLNDAGIPDCFVVHHMGHGVERARGDSRLRDWPDVEWRLVRQGDDPATPRYITAYGRDVDVPESQLVYEQVTRALTITVGSRKDAATRVALTAVMAELKAAAEPLCGRAIKTALKDHGYSKNVVDSALLMGVKTKALAFEEGPRNAKLYSVPGSVPVSPSLPVESGNSEPLLSASVPPPFREGTLKHSDDEGDESPEDGRDAQFDSSLRASSPLKARSGSRRRAKG